MRGLLNESGVWDIEVLKDLFLDTNIPRILSTPVSPHVKDTWRWKGDIRATQHNPSAARLREKYRKNRDAERDRDDDQRRCHPSTATAAPLSPPLTATAISPSTSFLEAANRERETKIASNAAPAAVDCISDHHLRLFSIAAEPAVVADQRIRHHRSKARHRQHLPLQPPSPAIEASFTVVRTNRS
nr:uncharacterized protein LOC109154171 [Ipomoea trifida]